MDFERYSRFYSGWPEGLTVRAGGTAAFDFDLTDLVPAERHQLFVTGETMLHYFWKNEPHYPMQYRSITDALDAEHADKAQYCLDLSSEKPEKYIRRVYKKVLWPPDLAYLDMNPVPDEWTGGIFVRTRGLRVEAGGYLRAAIEVRYKKEGVGTHYVGGLPDERYELDLPEGDCGWTELKQALILPKDKIASVGFWIEGKLYSGEAYLERPYLSADGENLLPDFTTAVSDESDFDWTAQYLSRKEWPEFRVTLNGAPVYEGEVFERCHRASEWTVPIPGGLLKKESNRLEITLISRYRDPLPYTFREAGIVSQPEGTLTVLAAPPAAPVNGEAAILVRTDRDGVTASFACPSGALTGKSSYYFEKKGLHGVRLACEKCASDVSFSFTVDGAQSAGILKRIVEKTEDGIVTGTGDLIYVDQDPERFEEYLSWYVSGGVGSLLTMRPTYRWSGTRVINEELWRDTARVLNELGIRYAVMMDGRELPGLDCNPTEALLEGPGFLGRQNHERDGAQFYWGRHSCDTLSEEQYADMSQRIYRENKPYTACGSSPASFIYEGGNVWMHHRPDTPRDMQAAHDEAVKHLIETRDGCARHTGPSVMFRCFYEAGYKWAGAETMYGSIEPLMAFERGAADCYGSKDIGVHHAVQWSSSPQDAPDHYRRYRLALYTSYMHGATEINTEEGLWHLEEYYSHFNRFSDACRMHRVQQSDFYRYTATHTRSGRFYAPAAFVHGALDGWHAFTNRNPWGLQREPLSDAEKSWQLWKTAYPLSRPGDALYVHGIEPDKPVGYYSGDPYGCADVLPVESDPAQYARYKALIFAGYNRALPADLDKLYEYLLNGGTALMTRAHFAAETNREKIRAYDFSPVGHAAAFLEGAPEWAESAVNGVPVSVAVNLKPGCEILRKTDNGLPLYVQYRVGKGILRLVNANAYPAHPAVWALYEGETRSLLKSLAAAEASYIECGNDVQFTVYDQPDGARHIYVTPVDWYVDPARVRKAVLRAGEDLYPVELPFGVMTKIVINGGKAAWPLSEDGEVLAVSADGIRVQGCGAVKFAVAESGKFEVRDVDFTREAVQMLR